MRADRWVVEGYAVTTHYIPTDGMIITEEALRKAVDDVLKRSTVLFNHDTNKPIGRVVFAEVLPTDGEYGLYVKVEISKTVPEVWEKIREGVINKFSVRAAVMDSYEEFNPEVGATVTYVTDFEIKEVSLVSVPADPMAKVTVFTIERELKMADIKRKAEEQSQQEKKQETVERQETVLDLLKEIRKMLLGLITALQEGKYPLPRRQLAEEVDILKIIEDALQTAGIALSGEVWNKIVEAVEKELKYSARQLRREDILKIIEDALKTAGIVLSKEVWDKIVDAVEEAEKNELEYTARHYPYPYPYPLPKGFENIRKMLEEIKQILVGFIESMKAGKYPLPARTEELLKSLDEKLKSIEDKPVVRDGVVRSQVEDNVKSLNTEEKLKVVAAAFGIKNYNWGPNAS